ncbi:MAG: NAD(P)/FAD-dependent oxidoreductase [Halomonadaceae bacterium]|nr:MAG: NAD(P)/FAD-dependent oxidoreductase [Halomonadaceae bacterium]
MSAQQPPRQTPSRVFDTYIVGTGISGIAAAIQLKKAGVEHFKIIEKASRVGGTWRDNTYPGCGCDVPSALYSYSFAPSSRWTRLFAKQPEILDYLEEVSRQYGIEPLIHFNTGLEQAQWDDKQHLWVLKTSQGTDYARTVIFATGPITEPKTPPIKGLDGFKGEMFHSARWNHDVDLTGKRVAVIGTGASAIQFVPRIQPQVKELLVFQRTAPWVLPKPDVALGELGQKAMATLPQLQSGWRNTVAGSLNLINIGLRHPSLLTPVSNLARQLLKVQIRDASLRQAVTPDFTLGCKRILFANDYYPALQADNTRLIAQGLVEVDGNTVIAANGERHEVDVIIWGTGFDVSHPPIGEKIINAKGERLSDLWRDSSPEAYLGTSLANTPNAFLMLGPNVLVYDSFFRIAEAQLTYIVDGVKQIRQRRISKLSIRPEVLKEHNDQVQKHLQSTVFNSGGCQSYYLDQNGRNFAAWPWSLRTLRRKLRGLRLRDYEVVYAPQRERA